MGTTFRAFIVTFLALLVLGGVLFSWKDAQTQEAESTAPPPVAASNRSANETGAGNETSGNETAANETGANATLANDTVEQSAANATAP